MWRLHDISIGDLIFEIGIGIYTIGISKENQSLS